MFPTLTDLPRSLAEHQILSVNGRRMKSHDDNARSSYKMSTHRLVAVPEAVQGLCGDLCGVTAVTRESHGQVCKLPSTARQRPCAEGVFGWTFGAIVKECGR